MPAVTPRPPSILKQRSTVGPEAVLSKYAMYDANREPPVEAQAWDGWPVEWNTPNWAGYGASDPSGYMFRVSTLMSCVDKNATQLGSFPIYGVDERTSRRVTLPSWATTPEPSRYVSFGAFMKEAATTWYLNGEAFIYATARDRSGRPARFVSLDPCRVRHEYHEGERVYMYDEMRLDGRDVLHIPYMQLPGVWRGIGPVEWLGRSLVSASTLEDYAAQIATHGVWAVLRHPGNLNAQQATDLKANWQTNRAANPGAPAVLSGGVEFETLSLSPTDMALLDLRTFDEQRICAALGVPPFLVALPNPGGMTYSNVSQVTDHHWKATLRPAAQVFADAIGRWALPRGTSLEFNRDEYTRPTLGERTAYYATMHSIGKDEQRPALTVDELRSAEGLQPYEEPSPFMQVAPYPLNARTPLED